MQLVVGWEHGAAEWHTMEAVEEEYDQISQRTREWGEGFHQSLTPIL